MLLLLLWGPHVWDFFFGPRYTWGPIYGSLKLTDVFEVIQVIDSIQVIQVIDSMYTEKVTISNAAIWWPNLELMQVVPSGGQICN